MIQRYQSRLNALGSEVFITLVSDLDNKLIDKLFREIDDQIKKFEQQFSRFLESSELTKFNQKAGEFTSITPDFKRLLVTSKNMGLKTKGLYNPFILPGLQKAGYLNSWVASQDKKSIDYTDRKISKVERIEIKNLKAKIPKHTALDFGGIGKGYLLDQLGLSLDQVKLVGYWLSLGGDIICKGYDLDNKEWEIGVQSAYEPEKTVDFIRNKDGKFLAIATSGITKRRGLKNGKLWHHIIDPRTNMPAISDVLTATVTSKEAVKADVFAKAVVIAGSSSALKYQDQDNAIDYFLVQLKETDDLVGSSRI